MCFLQTPTSRFSPLCFSSRESNPPPLPVTAPLPRCAPPAPRLLSRFYRTETVLVGRSWRPEVSFARSALIEDDSLPFSLLLLCTPSRSSQTLRIRSHTSKTEIGFSVTDVRCLNGQLAAGWEFLESPWNSPVDSQLTTGPHSSLAIGRQMCLSTFTGWIRNGR